MLGDPQSRSLVREIILRGPLSRVVLAKKAGLSQASLSRLLKQAVDTGLIVEQDVVNGSGPGRPARPLALNPNAGITLGVKLTESDLGIVAMDLRGTILSSHSRHLPSHDPTEVAETIRDAVDSMQSQPELSMPLLGVGVVIGGNVDEKGRAIWAPFLGWENVDFLGLLRQVIDVPVFVDNDVQALTTYQHWFGVARGVERFAVVTIGAGVGHGLVVDDQVVAAHRGGVGLAGHLPLDIRGPVCDLGHRGCAAANLTTRFLSQQYSLAQGKQASVEDLMRDYRAGNPVAKPIIELAAESLGKLIVTVANLDMCTSVVLSGEGIPLWDLKRELIESVIKEWRVPQADPVVVLVDRADHTNWSAGAATIALQGAFLK